MAKLSAVYQSRARRVHRVTQAQLGREGSMVLAGARDAVQSELYDRTPLRVSGAMMRAIRLKFMGNRFAVGFDPDVAPHAGRRLKMTGTSKTGHHLLDMNPNAYIRTHVYPQIRLLRAQTLSRIAGPGVTSRNGS